MCVYVCVNMFDCVYRSQYGDMLHDTERVSNFCLLHIIKILCYDSLKNKAYFKGVQYAVDTIMRQNKEPVVLDIGTGTGLLAMMAAKCGAKKITPCEVSGLLSI